MILPSVVVAINNKIDIYKPDNTGKYIKIEDDFYEFSGVGVLNGKLIDSSIDFSRLIKKTINDIDWIGSSGSFVSVVRIKESIYIMPDPVGAGMVYFYKENGIFMASSDIQSLIGCLKLNNIYLNKSSKYQAILLGLNDGYFGYTSYENIKSIESGSYIHINKSGVYFDSYGVEDFISQKITYLEALDEGKLNIEKNIYAASGAKKAVKIAHLTGGLDSRLVYSAICSNDSLNSWLIYCSGRDPYPDFVTARNICASTNASMTSFSGLLTENYPKNLKELYRLQSSACNGMIANMPIHAGMSNNMNTIVLSGGYGECYRGYWTQASDYPVNSIPGIIWGMKSGEDDNSIISDSLKNELIENLKVFFREKENSGWSKFEALQLLYLQHKNRYFVGNIAKIFSNYTARYDPLYSVYGFRAAFKAEKSYRDKKFVIFDLMNKFNPLVARLPFGTTDWPAEIKEKFNLGTLEWPKNLGKPSSINFLGSIENNNFFGSRSNSLRLPLPAGVSPWQWGLYKEAQLECLHLLESRKDIFDFLNKKIVYRILRNDLKNRVQIRQVFGLMYSLIWLENG